MKRKHITTIVAALLVAGIVLAGCQGIPAIPRTPQATPGEGTPQAAADQTAAPAADAASGQGGDTAQATGTDAAVPPPAAGGRIVADAKVVPVQSANLNLATGGIVQEVAVKEGDRVDAGQLLIKLDDARQQVGVAQAQASLQRAQANLDQLLAGARDEEIAQAEAGVASAEAAYNRIANAVAPGGVAQAQAGLAQAQANLQRTLEGATEQQIIAARADLKNAEAALKNATSAYNKIKDQPDVGMMPQSLALEQATIAYEAAKARLADLEAGATPATIAAARAGVSQAATQLETARTSEPFDVASAQAAVEQAKAQLELVKAGARPEAIQIAQADVAAATASLQNALVAVGDTELRAPFGGIIATVNTAVGEQVGGGGGGGGQPVIVMADTSAWEIETSDLTEFDVVGVQPGNKVTLTFDAIPDLRLPGTVSRIRPIGEDNRGDTVYKVVVTPDQNDPRLLWNMTAVVEFGGQ